MTSRQSKAGNSLVFFILVSRHLRPRGERYRLITKPAALKGVQRRESENESKARRKADERHEGGGGSACTHASDRHNASCKRGRLGGILAATAQQYNGSIVGSRRTSRGLFRRLSRR